MELWDERVEDGNDGRQTKGVEAMEDGVEGRQARENEKIEDGGERRQARGSRQSRLAWKGDGGGSEEVNGVGVCSPIKRICLFDEETPSHGPIPP